MKCADEARLGRLERPGCLNLDYFRCSAVPFTLRVPAAAVLLSGGWVVVATRRSCDGPELAQRVARLGHRAGSDPPFNGGRRVPELIEMARGEPVLAIRGTDSVRVARQVEEASPDVVVLMPCGYGLDQAAVEAEVLLNRTDSDPLTPSAPSTQMRTSHVQGHDPTNPIAGWV
jgi:hypothetical protein